MKKFCFILLAAIIALLSGCSQSAPEAKGVNIDDIVIEQDIVFIKVYSNYAWGYQYSGVIFDKNGCEYNFDFADKGEFKSDDERIAAFLEVLKDENAKSITQSFNEDSIKVMYSLLQKIDLNAGFNEEFIMCDYGQNTIYGLRYTDGVPELVTIYSYGDVVMTPNDANAKEICEYFHIDE